MSSLRTYQGNSWFWLSFAQSDRQRTAESGGVSRQTKSARSGHRDLNSDDHAQPCIGGRLRGYLAQVLLLGIRILCFSLICLQPPSCFESSLYHTVFSFFFDGDLYHSFRGICIHFTLIISIRLFQSTCVSQGESPRPSSQLHPPRSPQLQLRSPV